MYNATAYKLNAAGGIVSVEAVELDDDGAVIRACGHWSPWNGKPEFEAIWRSGFFSMVADVRIERDGAEGYRNRLARLALPATYTGPRMGCANCDAEFSDGIDAGNHEIQAHHRVEWVA